MHFILVVRSFILSIVCPLIHALTVDHAIKELALIRCAVFSCENTKALFLAVDILPFVFGAIWPTKYPIPIQTILVNLAYITSAI